MTTNQKNFMKTTTPHNLIFLLLSLIALVVVHAQKPYYLRLSKSTNSVYVTWTTFQENPAELASYTPFVEYGLNEKSLGNNVVGGVTKSYHNSTGFHHTVKLQNVRLGHYYYRVGGKGKEMSSEVYQFRVSNSSKVILYGDMGSFRSSNTIDKVNKRLLNDSQISMVYHVGDISYADDFPGPLFDKMFQHWLGMVEGITSLVPYQVCPGNHDQGCKIPPLCHDWKQDFRPYNYIFYMPGYEKWNHNMFYSFDQGDIHFTSFSTETDYPNSPFPQKFGDQMTWFVQDLKAAVANRKKVPWIVVIGHRPIYSSHIGQSNGQGLPVGAAANIQQVFEQILVEYKVDMFMMGHIHSYERCHPTYNNVPKCDSTCVTGNNSIYHNPEYPVHIVNGGAGCEEGISPTASFHYGNNWSANIFNKDEGYGVLETSKQQNQLVMNWKYFASKTDEVVDEMTIVKKSVE